MAPLVLKIKGNKTFSPFSTLSSEDDLSKTWRVCTKVKDSLENGSRLENLSWRLWFRQDRFKKQHKHFRRLSLRTARKLSSNVKLTPLNDIKLEPIAQDEVVQQTVFDPAFYIQQEYPGMNQFNMTQQPESEDNTLVQLDDILNVFNNAQGLSNIPNDIMQDGWDFGYPSPTNPYGSPTSPHMRMPPPIPDSDAVYVAGSAIPPPPTATLRTKILMDQEMRMNNSQQYNHPTTPSSITISHSMPLLNQTMTDHYSVPNSPTFETSLITPPPAIPVNNDDDDDQSKPICTNCGATSTPLWRRSVDDELLCNACGLYQKLHNAPRPKTLKPHNARKEAKDEEVTQLVCSNCATTTTPLWRRDDEGAPLCNACGLYLKLHHERRPLSMKTDIIKKRQRYESNAANKKQQQAKKKSESPSPVYSFTSSPHPLQAFNPGFAAYQQQQQQQNQQPPLDELISNYF
ncbi:hypothetical protein K501DRAFT_251491 [Backusella circina FSU 941]|nr:hypothetical protein K501DRAFT_251491 [Backusella circina FSU 941]